jgi:hypothetical protein
MGSRFSIKLGYFKLIFAKYARYRIFETGVFSDPELGGKLIAEGQLFRRYSGGFREEEAAAASTTKQGHRGSNHAAATSFEWPASSTSCASTDRADSSFLYFYFLLTFSHYVIQQSIIFPTLW